MELSTQVPRLPVFIAEDNLELGAYNVLQHIRPSWKKIDIKFKLLTDGITNKLVACKLNDIPDEETVLVRVYGNKTDLLIDRKAETKNLLTLNKVGLTPEVYATFQNGLAYEFVPGCTLNEKTVVLPDIYKLVAKRMARLHKVTVFQEASPEPSLWPKLEQFLALVPDVFTNCDIQKKFESSIIPKKCKIKEEIEYLKDKLVKLDSPVVFCHNDLLLGNVIYTIRSNTVTFIDYEYASFNYQAYDIGNHFLEFAGVNEVDYSKYPKEDLQKDWIKSYLEEYNDSEPSKEQIDKLYVQVNKFTLASHILWGMWSLIQAEHSKINFDFMGYGAIRFAEYFAKKDQLTSLVLPK